MSTQFLDSKNLTHPTSLLQGALGKVRRFDHLLKPNTQYTVKTLFHDEETSIELNLWELINKQPTKPNALPKFLGSYQDPSLMGNHSNLVFEFSAIKLQDIKILTFPQLYLYFKSLVNALAFLQTLGICHGNLTLSRLFLDPNKKIYMIDLAKNKDFLIKVIKQSEN